MPRQKLQTEVEERLSERVRNAESRIKDLLPELIDLQLKLARGGFPITEETWEPQEGLEPGQVEMVLTKRIVKRAIPDRQAGQYLLNRGLGALPTTAKLSVNRMSDEELIEFIEANTGSPSGS